MTTRFGPHRFELGVGNECARCHVTRWDADHFGGNQEVATRAYVDAVNAAHDLEAWRNNLKGQDRARVMDTHPRVDLQGRVGVIEFFTKDMRGSRVVSVRFLAAGVPNFRSLFHSTSWSRFRR